jgi:hypothetical protein
VSWWPLLFLTVLCILSPSPHKTIPYPSPSHKHQRNPISWSLKWVNSSGTNTRAMSPSLLPPVSWQPISRSKSHLASREKQTPFGRPTLRFSIVNSFGTLSVASGVTLEVSSTC